MSDSNYDEFQGSGREIVLDNAPRVMTAQKVGIKRDLARIRQDIAISAAGAGERFYFRWPTKDRDGKVSYVEGPSIKCALNVARLYGNCTVGTRVIDEGTHYLFEAFFVDLETGFNLMRPFRQRKSQKTMRTDADRQADLVMQVGASKSLRNVITNSLEELCDFAMDTAKNSLVDKIGKNIDGSRQRLLDRLGDIAVDAARVGRVVGRPVDQMLAADIARVLAGIQAVEEGMSSPDELWPLEAPKDAEPEKPKGLDQFDAKPEPKKGGKVKDAAPDAKPEPTPGDPDPMDIPNFLDRRQTPPEEA